MPIYVFRCDDCGEKFERLQKFSDPAPDTCPHCGKQNTVRKQVTAPWFRLAGNGWYETDFKSDQERRHNLAGDAGKPKDSTDKPQHTAGKPADTGKSSEAGKQASKPANPSADRKSAEVAAE